MKEPAHRQILRYWLAAIRQEESLASRPRPNLAQKARSKPPNLLDPGPGQPYFRVPADHAAFLSGKEAMVSLPLDDGRMRFFERWLRSAYREQMRAAKTGGGHPLTYVAGWPAVHLVHKEELATIFRFPVELVFKSAGRAFKTPTWEDKKAKRAPEPPNEIAVHNLAMSTGENAPLAIDLQLLSHTLGVHEDMLDILHARWAEKPTAPKKQIIDVLNLLDPEAQLPDEKAETLFKAIVEAAAKRAPGNAKVYPTAIVQDGSLAQTTFHLQRELTELLSDAKVPPKTALHAYLTGSSAELGQKDLKARFTERGLTASQKSAAEHALGSTLSAVCGPPGTGKTELILNLAAQALVDRADNMAKMGHIGSELFVVASTNNRAVDNAIDPLANDRDRLPLALRCGSQEITASVTKAGFERALRWLEEQKDDQPFASLKDALEAFKEAKNTWLAAARPNRKKERKQKELADLKRRLGELEPAGTEGQVFDPALVSVLEKLEEGLIALLDIIDETDKGRLMRLERAWKHYREQHLGPAESRSIAAAARVAAILPPAESTLDTWSESIEAALVHIEEALSPVQAARRAEREKTERAELEQKIAALEAKIARIKEKPTDPLKAEALGYALFFRAREVREKWAIQNRAVLTAALQRALEALNDTRSLRRFFEKDRSARAQIFALYPTIGCTLLSLGNVFADAPDTIHRLVIDEAGQCHPAYAISGLMRARQALIIGDVYQLTPVIELAELDETRARRSAKITLDDAELEIFRVYDKSPASAQSLADRADPERRILTDHFRCQPEIIAVSDALCNYGLTVHTPRRSFADRVPWLSSPLLKEDIRGAQFPSRGSWANREEADRAVAIVLELSKYGVDPGSIAVLTPYVGQLELLYSMLRARGLEGAIALGTVHRFQGGERDIVILTTAISEPRSLHFLNERPNLLNVAVSRARDHFVLLGHEPVLRQGRLTRHLVERASKFATG